MVKGKSKLPAVKARPTTGLRMQDLTRATGLPKSTILHYVAQGLLPGPVKTSHNMAYYDPSCVERARFIKSIQGMYSFPLEKIKKVLQLKDQGKDVGPLVQLNEVIFGRAGADALTQSAFRKTTGLSALQIAELIGASLLLPLNNGSFNQDDVEVGRVYADALNRGITVKDLAFYPEAAKVVVDHEMSLRQRITGALPEEQDAQVTGRMVQGARILRSYVIERTFQRRVSAAKSLKDKGGVS